LINFLPFTKIRGDITFFKDNDVQQDNTPFKIALIGNPNCGKTSIFNQLTGLNQKVGNFPGVTVDKKTGKLTLPNGRQVILIDFPGTYSFYPTSKDERIVVQTFANPDDENYPDAVVYVADVTKLEKHLLLFTQIRDLGLPTILALNMSDVAQHEGLSIDEEKISRKLGTVALCVSGRTGAGLDQLKEIMGTIQATDGAPEDSTLYRPSQEEARLVSELQHPLTDRSPYQRILLAHHYSWLPDLDPEKKAKIARAVQSSGFQDLQMQVRETMQRYDHFTPIVQQNISRSGEGGSSISEKLDRILTHRIIGPIIFFILMLMVFQAIFSLASYPMDLIDFFFGYLIELVRTTLPTGWFPDLIADGLLAGLGGILVFVPQIAILFLLISILEEVGYMARAAFMFDRLMQTFGLNGRSIVALISGGACAIPAVMSTRTIANWKERLITILVTPFISCSARIPVYTVLIAFAVPQATVLGFFNLQGLAFMGLYLLGIAAALGSAYILKLILKTNESSFLMLEMPEYRLPVVRNVVLTVWEKVKTFAVEAGKIILIISLLLWILSSYGPTGDMEAASREAQLTIEQQDLSDDEADDLMASRKLEASFAGHIGKFIEPAIEPLGFDWKIGIALITSFAAREVFVGTMATIYSIGSADDEFSIRKRMAEEVSPKTGERVYNQATSWSLLLFYVFAMQCMSTLAIVKRETNSWKWPTLQFFMMTGLAYLSSLLAYQLLS